jgi:hypothetical protein
LTILNEEIHPMMYHEIRVAEKAAHCFYLPLLTQPAVIMTSLSYFRTFSFLIVLLLVIAGCAPAEQAEPEPSAEAITAFLNVNVLPMDSERVLENQTVLVEGDRITTVGPTASVTYPEDATQIDGSGKYLIPGLAEMHGHIPSRGVPDWYVEDVLFLFVANGITTVRGMQGAPGQLELKQRVFQNELVSPALYLAGPGFTGDAIDSPEQAAQRVRDQKAADWDLLKVLPGLTIEEYDAMARTANEVGVRFAGHVPGEVGLVHAIEMGQETFDHLDGYMEHLNGRDGPMDDAAVQDVVNRSRDADVWVVPTMVLWEVLQGATPMEDVLQFDGLAHTPKELVEAWTESHRQRMTSGNQDAARQLIENRMRLLKALSDGGVRILMGTDAPQQFSVPGFSIHEELNRMVEAGLSPYEVLKSGTANVGTYFEVHDQFGLIQEGHRADLLLLNGNPLDDISQTNQRAGVMVRGNWLNEADIQARLSDIETRMQSEDREPVERTW